MRPTRAFLLAWGFFLIVALAPSLYQMTINIVHGQETTGVCIFKGPASFGLFSSSDGVPLRGIGVEAWHSGSFGVHTTDSAGNTDRLGCFTFKLNWGQNDFLSYTYNGTQYIDSVQAGVVLRDNVP